MWVKYLSNWLFLKEGREKFCDLVSYLNWVSHWLKWVKEGPGAGRDKRTCHPSAYTWSELRWKGKAGEPSHLGREKTIASAIVPVRAIEYHCILWMISNLSFDSWKSSSPIQSRLLPSSLAPCSFLFWCVSFLCLVPLRCTEASIGIRVFLFFSLLFIKGHL